jgi:hypothetical protein
MMSYNVEVVQEVEAVHAVEAVQAVEIVQAVEAQKEVEVSIFKNIFPFKKIMDILLMQKCTKSHAKSTIRNISDIYGQNSWISRYQKSTNFHTSGTDVRIF